MQWRLRGKTTVLFSAMVLKILRLSLEAFGRRAKEFLQRHRGIKIKGELRCSRLGTG